MRIENITVSPSGVVRCIAVHGVNKTIVALAPGVNVDDTLLTVRDMIGAVTVDDYEIKSVCAAAWSPNVIFDYQHRI